MWLRVNRVINNILTAIHKNKNKLKFYQSKNDINTFRLIFLNISRENKCLCCETSASRVNLLLKLILFWQMGRKIFFFSSFFKLVYEKDVYIWAKLTAHNYLHMLGISSNEDMFLSTKSTSLIWFCWTSSNIFLAFVDILLCIGRHWTVDWFIVKIFWFFFSLRNCILRLYERIFFQVVDIHFYIFVYGLRLCFWHERFFCFVYLSRQNILCIKKYENFKVDFQKHTGRP